MTSTAVMAIAFICATAFTGLSFIAIYAWAYRMPMRFVMHYPCTRVTRHPRVRRLWRWITERISP